MTSTKAAPARSSSSIPAAPTHLADTDPLRQGHARRPLAHLATIHDSTAARTGDIRWSQFRLAAAAVLAGARSMTAIAEWAADSPQPVQAALGARRNAPGHWVVPTKTTIRRTLARVDPTSPAAALAGWLTDRNRPAQQRGRDLAVDARRYVALAAPTGRCTCSP